MADDLLNQSLEALSGYRFGKYRGIVVENVDPLKRGRLQVQVPTLFGETAVWAMPCVPVAGLGGEGFFSLPPQDALVWIEFEQGVVDFPIWSGCFWKAGALASADAVPGVKFWKTDQFLVRIDDDAGELRIEMNNGGKITVTGQEVAIEGTAVSQTAGGNVAKLSQANFDVMNGALQVV